MEWVDVNDALPEFDTEVLVLIEQRRFEIGMGGGRELWPPNPYYRRIGKLRAQFRTGRPFWVAAWDFEALEDEAAVVTHWMALPGPPKVKRIHYE